MSKKIGEMDKTNDTYFVNVRFDDSGPVVTEIYADYNKKEQKLLRKYLSSDSENSTFKGIPMSLYKEVTRLLPITDRRIKFRGKSKPGYTRPKTHTLKKYADTFAVYYNNNRILHLGRPGWSADVKISASGFISPRLGRP